MKGLVNNIGDAATRFGHKVAFKVKKASPELLLVGGIACLIGGTVMACKATKKANDILDEGRAITEDIKDQVAIEGVDEGGLDPKIAKKEVAKEKLKTLGKLAGAYAPSVALGAAGIAMIFTSHGIMRKRQGALLASYNALDAAFRSYRERVMAEDGGKERDQRYLYGEKKDVKDLTEAELNELALVDRVNRDAADMINASGWYSPYSYRFDAMTSWRFSMHPFSNLNTIREVETIMTSRLREKGYVCLNEALHELGMNPVPWGQLVGRIWKYDGENDIFEIDAVEEYPETPGSAILITFKCDGTIWDKL